ncbi:MAG: ArsR/SmtB family transcription factor [Culicoidibacterales bacterium]
MNQAQYFKALSEPIRLQLIEYIANGQNCICHLQCQFEVSQPTLSHHMKILVDAGVVNAEKIGKNVYYTIAQSQLTETIAYLTQLGSRDVEVRDCEPCEE